MWQGPAKNVDQLTTYAITLVPIATSVVNAGEKIWENVTQVAMSPWNERLSTSAGVLATKMARTTCLMRAVRITSNMETATRQSAHAPTTGAMVCRGSAQGLEEEMERKKDFRNTITQSNVC